MFAPVGANCVDDLIHRPLSADARKGRINSAPSADATRRHAGPRLQIEILPAAGHRRSDRAVPPRCLDLRRRMAGRE
jgi:hypothetical protein